MALSKLRGKIRHKIPYFILGNYLAYFFCSLLGDVRLFTFNPEKKFLHRNILSKYPGTSFTVCIARLPASAAYFNKIIILILA